MIPKFSVDEKVLCYHGPLLYEAKCIKIKKESNEYQYFVHYQGWNKNWDEWITDKRMLKQVGENFEKQKRLLATHLAETRANKKIKKETKKGSKGGSDSGSNSRASTPVGDRPPGPGRPLKRTVADDERSTSSRDEELPVNAPIIGVKKETSTRKRMKEKEADEVMEDGAITYNIDIPEELKYVLANDWELVAQQRKLFSLPAKVTVSNIIDQYIDHLETVDNITPQKKLTAMEVIRGLGEHFNASVGPQLLYDIENLQYQEVSNQGAVQPSDIYGSPHLLRLMVKISGYLESSKIKEMYCKLIEEHIEDFLSYLEMNRSMFFTSKNYIPATPEFLARCRGLNFS